MKLLISLLCVLLLQGCDSIGRAREQVVASYLNDCISKGYSGVRITTLYGIPTNWYKCVNQ